MTALNFLFMCIISLSISGKNYRGQQVIPDIYREQMARFGNNPDLLHEQQPENSEKKVRPTGLVKWTSKGPYILKSFDNGKIWGNDAKRIAATVPGWNCSAKVREMPDGSILMVYYEEGDGSSIRIIRFKLPEAENSEQFSEPKRVEALPLKPKKSVTNTLANWQLFIDDYWIEHSTNTLTKIHQPEKYSNNPIIKSDVPWEENPYCFGTVIFDEEDSIFKFWYQSYNHVEGMQERTPIHYSTSTDGINWFRPNLGVIEYQGSIDNNIVLQNYGFHDLYSPGVIKDNEDPDPAKRYKMIWWDFPLGAEGYQDDGMCVAFSPDGIHWTKYSGKPRYIAGYFVENGLRKLHQYRRNSPCKS